MTWLIWRRHRIQLAVATAVLIAFELVMAISHHYMSNEYHEFYRTCNVTNSCDQAAGVLYQGAGYNLLQALHRLSLVLPVIIGVFLGVPLAGKDFEDGTHKLVWTQTTTRLRWITTKTAWAILLTVVFTGVISATITWWYTPLNAINQFRFMPEWFDIQGIVPVAYSVFALGAGVLTGVLFRRIIPAIATTIGSFIFVRILTDTLLRPHYQTAKALTLGLAPKDGTHNGPLGSAWVISQHIQDPSGHAVQLFKFGPGSSVFNLCPPPMPPDQSGYDPLRCLVAHGYSQVMTYQAANRYWTFQGIESAIFVVAGMLLIGLAIWRVNKMDA